MSQKSESMEILSSPSVPLQNLRNPNRNLDTTNKSEIIESLNNKESLHGKNLGDHRKLEQHRKLTWEKPHRYAEKLRYGRHGGDHKNLRHGANLSTSQNGGHEENPRKILHIAEITEALDMADMEKSGTKACTRQKSQKP